MESSKIRLRVHLIIFAAVMAIAVAGTMYLEHLSFVDALYYSIVTVATVGYGDIVPKTPAGKILSLVIICTGVTTFLAVAANATELFLNRRDQETRFKKLNMMIGLFFSEAGTRLLSILARSDANIDFLREHLTVRADWSPRQFAAAGEALAAHRFDLRADRIDLHDLDGFLIEKSALLVGLMENPYMLEHESFTDLVVSVLHLKEELESRDSLDNLPAGDHDHLAGDMKRAYAQLARLWLTHLGHLKVEYPFLFSLALRKNPFDPDASVTIQ